MQKNPHFFSSKRKWWPDALLLSLNPCCNCSASNLLPRTFNSSCVYKGSGFFLCGCARADSKSGSCHSFRKSPGKPRVWLKTLQSLSTIYYTLHNGGVSTISCKMENSSLQQNPCKSSTSLFHGLYSCPAQHSQREWAQQCEVRPATKVRHFYWRS